MSSLLHRSWDILSQHLLKASISLIFLLTTPHLQAIHDTNQNGVSDLWEEKFNSGALYLNFTPTADPDADGWTNAQEAAAGTDPTTGVGPIGHVRTEITHTPAVYLSPEEEGGPPQLDTPEVMTITWPTVAGKKYTLLFSTDLTAGNWTAIGSPRIGAGTEIGTSIPLTQPDGTTPAALFWRVTIADEDWDADTLTNAEEAELGSRPYSSDGDNDGLSDLAELFTYHTNPMSRDSDGDGVSDPDEILVDFTNPLTATDADGDGIPDDFEKHLAKQLLASQPDPTVWSTYYAGLLAGNLDATHDYTGDGMNARELAETLNNIPAAGPADSGYLVELQGRRNSLQWAYYYPPSSPSSSRGTYLHSVPNGYDIGVSITPTANLSSQYLLSRIDGVAWKPSPITPGDQMDLSNNQVESAFRRSPTPDLSSNGTKFQGRISQTRCRLIATNPGHEAYSKTYIKVVSNSYYFTWDHWQENGVISAEPFTVQFPKGKMLSEWYEFKAPIIDETGGRAASLGLRPVDIVAVFGFEWQQTGKDRMDNALAAMVDEPTEFKQIGAETSTFYIKGKPQGATAGVKYWAIQTARSEAAIKSGLASAPYVVFEGHANMGLGPAFNNQPAKISDFTNFGNPQAAINWEYMRTTEYPNFTTITAAETPSPVANYMVLPQKINMMRYENTNGVGAGQNFTLKGTGLGRHHLNRKGGNEILIVNAGKADLPTLGYQAFFYNSCNTARDFGEVFQHGKFFCSNVSCFPDYGASVEFIEGLISGETWTEILFDLNDTHALDDTIVGPAYRLVE